MPAITHIPLTDIEDHAIIRDRSHLDPAALDELKTSIRQNGLRLPIEVMAGGPPYPLLSGLRRITAFRELAAEGGADTIPALIRPAMTRAEALAAVVEENEIREPLSAWEKGRVIHIAHEEALFDTIEAAAEALFPAASKVKRSRLRAIARAVEAMDGALTAPELWSLRQCLRLASAVRAGFAPVMRAALAEDEGAPAADQWRIIQPYLEEAEALPEDRKPIGAKPVRLARPRRGMTVRRERTKGGWALVFSGPDAGDALLDRVFWEVERLVSK